MKTLACNKGKLAHFGGDTVVSAPHPHYVWPPKAKDEEIFDLVSQRQTDIRIPGNSGPIKELELNFLAWMKHSCKYAVAFNSGTTGLLAAYFAIGIDEGDEVIVPALTYHAAVSPLFILRGKPVIVDIDLNSRCIDADKIEAAITERTKAITVVHQWGHPGNLDKIMRIAKKYNLAVVEDCSHAHGSKYHNKLCGSFGDVAVFSLQANKTICAGEGGILVTNKQSVYERAILLGHNRDRAKADVVSDLNRYWTTGFGLKLRMSPFNAIIAIHSLKQFPSIMQSKQKCLNYFTQRLNEIDYIKATIPEPGVTMGAWYGFKPIYLKEKLGIPIDLLIEILRAEGVEVSAPSGKPLFKMPLYKEPFDEMFPSHISKVIPEPDNYPVANFVAENALSFPTFYQWPKDKEIIDQYITAMHKVAAALRGI